MTILATYPTLAERADGLALHELRVRVNLQRPSCRLQQTEFVIRPGLVDEAAIELFGYSQCVLLAAAMHERTGWPFAPVEQLVDDEWKWAHAGVISPAGLMVDIHGLRSIADAEISFTDQYGPQARVRTVADQQALLRVLACVAVIPAGWRWADDISTAIGREVVEVFADVLVAKATGTAQVAA